MGRKAKEAAQKKIGDWTKSRRNVSKTTTKSENTNASNENRTPLQTHSQSDINAMKNCSVRLEKIPNLNAKTRDTVTKTPVKNVPDSDVIVKDKQAGANNIYDYSFDADDEPGPMKQTEDEMKDLFDKLAKNNIIEVKKYRPKNVKNKKKPDEDVPAKKQATQKRRREKHPIDTEPPQKKLNLKAKVAKIDAPKSGALSAKTVAVSQPPQPPQQRNDDAENLANNNAAAKKVTIESKQMANAKVALRSSPRKPVNTVNNENVNVQPRLRNRVFENFQSTPKSSTPLATNSMVKGKENNRSINSLFFDNASPLVRSTRSTRANIQKHRLQLSAINDSNENVPATKSHENDENMPQVQFDDDNFDFGDNMANDPDPDVDKENFLDRPSTSAAALSAQNKPSTSSAASSLWDQPSTSAAALQSLNRTASTSKSISNVQNKSGGNSSILRSREQQPSTSSAAQTPRRDNDRSIFEIQETSDYNIFSPTKRVQRVYGRSPLKNITSEVNNTNSPSFEIGKSMPRSFGVLPKSTANSIQTVNSTKESNLTLPEASYFSSRRVAQDFDRSIENQNFADNCFGFDDADDEEINMNEETDHAQHEDFIKTEAEKLKEVRARLKRYLHNPDAEPNESIKMSKVTNIKTVKEKNMAKKAKTLKKTPVKPPIESPAKTAKSPAKPKRNIVFADAGAKQKDIRNAFTAKTTDKHSKSKDNPATILFEEVETVQDRRRSYSRPQRQRKRRISIDSDESEDEQQLSDDEEYDENGKPTKRAKRRKKTAEPDPKELEELDEFAKKLNEHFEEIDSFEVVVE